MTPQVLQTIRDWMTHAGSRGMVPYLVLDAAWQENLAERIRSDPAGWEPLLGEPGERKQESHRRSPLLVNLDERPDLLEPWLQDGFKERLGIVIFSRLDLRALRTSLKRFVSVLLPGMKKPGYLRFYDARTLHCFLTSGFAAQWQDFMQGIELLAAPTDFAQGWSAYRLIDGELETGTQSDNGDLNWTKIPPFGADNAYEAAFPFRRIDEPQYTRLMECADRAFSIEIAQFLLDAFPEECRQIEKAELLQHVIEARRNGAELGYDSEDAQFYYAVLAFMGGLDFHQKPAAKAYLGHSYFDPATRLEKLLQGACRQLHNSKLAELVDKTEITITYAAGEKIRFKQFSGKVLERQ